MATAQMALWNDVRMPDDYYEHFKKTGCCLNCRVELRHPAHALNHWKRLHTKKVKTKPVSAPVQHKFFVWKSGQWIEVPVMVYLMAQRNNQATAITKG